MRRLTEWLVVAGILLVMIAFSNSAGRATPEGNYRPSLPPDALATGCFPLPRDVRFDFAYQVRRDGNVGTPTTLRRSMLVQFDLIDAAEARASLIGSFKRAGFTEVTATPGQAPSQVVLTAPGVGPVRATITPYDVAAPVAVRGSILLDLPADKVSAAAPATADCTRVSSTKRFYAPDGSLLP